MPEGPQDLLSSTYRQDNERTSCHLMENSLTENCNYSNHTPYIPSDPLFPPKLMNTALDLRNARAEVTDLLGGRGVRHALPGYRVPGLFIWGPFATRRGRLSERLSTCQSSFLSSSCRKSEISTFLDISVNQTLTSGNCLGFLAIPANNYLQEISTRKCRR